MEIIQEVRKTQVQAIRIKRIIYMIWHGNVVEWTQEADSTGSRTFRGGNYLNSGSGYPVANRGVSNPTYDGVVGIRFSSHFNIEPVTPDSEKV